MCFHWIIVPVVRPLYVLVSVLTLNQYQLTLSRSYPFSPGEIMPKYMEPCLFTYIKFFDRFNVILICWIQIRWVPDAKSLSNFIQIYAKNQDGHQKWDIVCPWFSYTHNDITDAELRLEGYVMFRKDRIGKKGGGVLLYIKDTIPAYEVQLQNEADCNEAIWCNLVVNRTYNSYHWSSIIFFYRCPNITKQNNETIHNAIWVIFSTWQQFRKTWHCCIPRRLHWMQYERRCYGNVHCNTEMLGFPDIYDTLRLAGNTYFFGIVIERSVEYCLRLAPLVAPPHVLAVCEIYIYPGMCIHQSWTVSSWMCKVCA